MSTPRQYLTAAKRCADWFIANQIYDMATADSGRYLSEIKPKTFTLPIGPSIAWTTGMTVQAMIMMYQQTKDKKYLVSAQRAGEYIKTLQILDPRVAKNFGMIREIHTQTDWAHPRDALSGAWGLLHLGLAAKDKDSLQRAVLFGGWFRRSAMKKGYPAWTAYVDNRKPDWKMGSFHGGSALFFMDLYRVTGDGQWMEKAALPILNTYIRRFVRKDGSINIVVDEKTGRDITGRKKDGIPAGWKHMHRYNDDFTALALMRGWQMTGKDTYMKTALKYLDWAMGDQNRNGSFGKPAVPSACASLILELLDASRLTGEEKYARSAEKAGPPLLDQQELTVRDKRVYGGIYGISKGYTARKDTLNIRTAAYALAAYLRLGSRRRKFQCYTV